MQNLRLGFERKFQHVHHTEDTRLCRLDGIVLIMNRTRRTSQIINFVELSPERLRDVMQHKRKVPIVHQLLDVPLRPRK